MIEQKGALGKQLQEDPELGALYGTLVRRSRSAREYHLTRRGQAQLQELKKGG